MPRVIIDGTEYEVAEGRNMLEAALDNGLDLPYFCWHPAMRSVGACRQCAVRLYKDESDTRGKIVMACMTPAKDGTRISMKDPEATEFRRYLIEWLMTNHPHDCPVCDEGGECHLQDMTVMCGHVYRRFRFRKRTYTNQYLGPFVTHEMNRCIQCYRCVRFYRNFAGGRDFDVFGSKNRIYFGREVDGVLQSEFSGNLVEVCPTGVFTDKTSARHYTRKWDLQTTPSVCAHCGLGCNTIPCARYDGSPQHPELVEGSRDRSIVRRVVSRFNGDVNGYFLCDRGRYGYEFANTPGVSGFPLRSNPETLQRSNPETLERARELICNARGLIGIGSPRASLESNYALQKLVGGVNFSTGLSAFEHDALRVALNAVRNGPARTPSLAEVEQYDAIAVLGVDPTNEAPMLDYSIRQAMNKSRLDISRKLKIPDWDAYAVRNALQDMKGKLYIAAPWTLKLAEIAAESVQTPPPGVIEYAGRIRDALAQARKPLVVTGISAGSEIVRAAAELAWSLCEVGNDCGLFVIVPEANTLGVGMIGGISVDEAARRIESGEADTLVVLENDLSRRLNVPAFKSLIGKIKNLVVLDCIENDTTRAAGAAVPTPVFFGTDGTFVNNEGRAQRFYSVRPPHEGATPAWRALCDLCGGLQPGSYEDVLRDLARDMPEFAPALDAAPFADWRSAADQKIARQPQRFSGRTAIHANVMINEPQPPDDLETPLAYSMEGDQNPPPSPLIPRFWWPGWNSENSINKFQIEVGGPLHGGNPGKRLIEVESPKSKVESREESTAHPTFPIPKSDEFWLIPRPFIFGSEELSRLAAGIMEVTPEAAAQLCTSLAAKLGLADGQIMEIEAVVSGFPLRSNPETLVLPVRIDDSIADGVIAVPLGFDETMGVVAPTIGRLK